MSLINYDYLSPDTIQGNSVTLILKLTSRLELIVLVTAFFTFESNNNNLLEKWDLGEQESGLSVLFAVHAKTFNDGGYYTGQTGWENQSYVLVQKKY